MKPGTVIVAGLTAAATGIYRTVERATRPKPDPPCTPPAGPVVRPLADYFDDGLGCWRNIDTVDGLTVCEQPAAGPTGLCAEHRAELRNLANRTGLCDKRNGIRAWEEA